MKKRRITRTMALIPAAALAAGLVLSMPSVKTPVTVQALYDQTDFNYTEGTAGQLKIAKYNDRIEITGCADGVSDLEIPATIEGLPVTGIGRYAFQYSSVKSLTLPDSVKTIGYWAFTDCPDLKSVKLGSGLETIEIHAFENCPSLTDVEFPSQLVDVHTKAFDNTPWLTAQRQKDPLVIINGALIDAMTAKGDIVLPSDVKLVSAGAFTDNADITSVVFPQAVPKIDDDTFARCINLKSVEAVGAEKIGATAFIDCAKLDSLKLSDKLKTIEDYAFDGATSAATITFYGSRESWEQVTKPQNDTFIQRANLVFESSLPTPPPTEPPTDPPTEPPTTGLTPSYGDANCDGRINVADAVAVLQYVANQKKYDLGEQGILNADIDGSIGITGTDARVIQMIDASLISPSDLPLSR